MLTEQTVAAAAAAPPTLFDLSPRCFECSDLGFTLNREGQISTCWRISAGAAHNPASAAAQMLRLAANRLMIRKIVIDPHVFQVARQIAAGTAEKPVKREQLIEGNFQYTRLSLRAFQGVVETLRSVWLLPVGSRKGDPSGYWIVTDADDFKSWVERAKSAPLTQLTTIHRVAKANFPVFAEQMEIEFWKDSEGGSECTKQQ